MNKKIIVLVSALIVAISFIGGIMLLNHKDENNNSNNQSNVPDNQKNNGNTTTDKSKVLVLYFSATGNTKTIAEYIKNTTGGDIVEIIPKDEYTTADLNYSNNNCRANKEQNDDNARPEIKNSFNFEDYDIIYLGYPIWWNTVPKIILTLFDNYDLSNKTIIPFCTSGGSGISQSENDLKKYNSKINWVKGKGFNSFTKENEVSNWINGLNLNE